jgi:hypothetical protein
MEERMTRHIRHFLGLALLLAAISASAQITHTIEVKVPFPFVAAGKSWPAAGYRVKIDKRMGLVTLTSPGITEATMLTSKDDRPAEGGKTYLRFRHYGEHWVLQEVTLDGTAQLLNPTKLEREIARLNRPGKDALIAAGPTVH